MKKSIVAIGGALVLLLIVLFGSYNGLVTQSQAIDGQWAQVETQYQRRYDLIPNIVSSTKGFLEQEKEIYSDIAEARTRYSGAQTSDERAAAAGSLESALGRLLVIVENYPQLKSNETVARLMDELSGTENRISVERRRYNELVQGYNTRIKTIPTNMIVGVFGFGVRNYFQAAEGSEQAPNVEL